MSKNLLNISGKISDPIVSIYALIAEVAKQNKVPFFIIGATARDIIFEHVYAIPVPRATRDIDLAVNVATWDDFTQLKNQLIATGSFSSTKMVQRLDYQNIIPVDIVPFGGIETNGSIDWPPDHSIQMNVLGFGEAYKTTSIIRFRDNPILDIHVVTPAALVILKLIAWQDRKNQNSKDALDLAFILTEYLNTDHLERISKEHPDLFDDPDFDFDITGARLLGRDIAAIVSPITEQMINTLLDSEIGQQQQYKLVEAMSTRQNGISFEKNLKLLEALYEGLTEKHRQ